MMQQTLWWFSRVGALLLVLALLAAWSSPQESEDAGPVPIRAVAQKRTVGPGDTLVIAVVMDHPEKYHSWPNKEVALEKNIDESADRTQIGLAKTGVPKDVQLSATQWPKPHVEKVADPSGEKESVSAPVFSGRTVIYMVLDVAAGAAPGEVKIPVQVHYQSCDDRACYPPRNVSLSVPVTIGTGVDAVANEPDLFSGFDPTKAAGPTPASSPQPAASPSLLGIGLGGGLIVLFLASILGGAILNLTPCVLPIIPIKVMSMVEHAGSAHRRAVLGSWMAFGVVAFWATMSLPIVLPKVLLKSVSQIDPSQLIFGHWWLTLSLGMVIALMGLGIMGLFSINLPQAVYMVSPKADSAKGSFFYGVMTGVLGLPCFGFVAGGLLVGSATLSAASVFIVFLGLGIGMAAPYLILTLKPALINKIPRTGPASDLVKQVMGLLLLAAAAFFVGSGIQALVAQKPYIAASMPFWVVAFFVLIAGLWLTVRTLIISKTRWPRIVMPLLSAALVVTAVGYAWISTQADRASVWREFSESKLAQAKSENKVIVIDFTAHWCLTCKFLKASVLDREPVISELRRPDLLPLVADVSNDTDPGWAKLKDLGQTGVPTLAIYGPALPKPLIYNAYTKDTVLKAIEQARGPRLTNRTP